MQSLLASTRLLRALLHAVRGWIIITFKFPHLTPTERAWQVENWSKGMLSVLGIALKIEGHAPATGPVLLVSNHISWLDILVIHAAHYCRFVSKSEVRNWPLIGKLATGSGTLYIERASRRDALRVVHTMAESLLAGDVVAIFPEGTTGDGIDLLPFHANLIQAALSVSAQIQPVALNFIDSASHQTSFSPCFVGDDTLVASLWRTLCSPPITAVVRFGVVEASEGRDRRTWAASLQQSVADLRQSKP